MTNYDLTKFRFKEENFTLSVGESDLRDIGSHPESSDSTILPDCYIHLSDGKHNYVLVHPFIGEYVEAEISEEDLKNVDEDYIEPFWYLVTGKEKAEEFIDKILKKGRVNLTLWEAY